MSDPSSKDHGKNKLHETKADSDANDKENDDARRKKTELESPNKEVGEEEETDGDEEEDEEESEIPHLIPLDVGSIDEQEAADREEDIVIPQVQDLDIGWRILLLVQFEWNFHGLLLLTCFIASIVSLCAFSLSLSTPTDTITYWRNDVIDMYLADIIFLYDTICMIIYKRLKWEELRYIHKERQNWLVIVDVITLVPIDMVYALIAPAPMNIVVTSLRLRYTLRMCRVFDRLERNEKNISIEAVRTCYANFIITLIVLIVLLGNVHLIFLCYVSQENECKNVFRTFMRMMYAASSKLTLCGSAFSTTDEDYELWFYGVVNVAIFFYIKCFVIAKCISAFKQGIQPWALYSNRLAYIFHCYAAEFKKDVALKNTCDEYYLLFWKNRYGFLHPNVGGILPTIAITEIKIEMAWKLFQHSHLFRKEDFHFLHYLSIIVKHDFMIPGEVIFQRGELKDKLVYILSGTIQLYSQLDGETPVMSLAAGTCLGESSLFYAFNSACTVICTSYCELSVVYRKDFVHIRKKFPKKYHILRERVYNRFEKAKKYSEVVEYHRYKYIIKEKARVMSIQRLRFQLAKLLSTDKNFEEKYMKMLKVPDRLWLIKTMSLVFCPYYLDMLVLANEESLVNDSVFLRTEFPYVLQPNSVIIKYWNMLTAVLLLILMFMFPYFTVFTHDIPGVYDVFVSAVTIVWIADVYIQVSTAVKSGNVIVSQISQIALHRAGTLTFFFDVVAAIPVEIIVQVIVRRITKEQWYYMQVNRIVKFHRISWLFKPYVDSITHDMVLYRYMKTIIYFAFIVYWVAAIHCLLLYIENDKDSFYYHYLYDILKVKSHLDLLCGCLYLATRVATGLALFLPSKGEADIFYIPLIIIQIFCCLFYVTFMSNICSAETLKARNKLIVQEYLYSITFVIRDLEMQFINRVYDYFEHQWEVNGGIAIIYQEGILVNMPRNMYLIVQYSHMQETMLKIPLFQEIENSLLMSICGFTKEIFIPPRQTMACAGEASATMYIIVTGFCDQISTDQQIKTLIGPDECFALVECCMGIPVIHNVITRTSCRLLSINYRMFLEAMTPYPGRYQELQEVVKACILSIRSEEAKVATEDAFKKKRRMRRRKDEVVSVISFGYRIAVTSERGKKYHTIFDSLGYWGFMRYFLLRHTFTSYGTYLKNWEIGRCIFALLSSVLYLLPLSNSNFTLVVKGFLDLTAITDIYLRHHVCYFDKNGIEITHPLKTATYYWKHAFVVDVLAVFPFETTITILFGLESVSPQLQMYMGINRTLQTYRIWQFFEHKIRTIKAQSRLLEPLKWMPFYLIVTVFLGNVILNMSCTFNPSIPASKTFTEGVKCDSETWISKSGFRKPLSPMKVFLYGVYFVTSIVTGVGLQGFGLKNMGEVIVATSLAIVGFFSFEFLTAKIIGLNLSRNTDLMMYQHEMAALMTFFNGKTIEQKLKLEFVEHFEYDFRKKRCKQYHEIMDCFNSALKEDILYNLFGSSLTRSQIFENANISFFRSLLLASTHEIILRHGIISSVNQIHGNIYFIHNGKVDVLGPDGSYLLTLLPGSMFGNLDDIPYGRRTLTMKANSHVELLCIPTVQFYAILKRYPRLHAHYHHLTVIHTDYLDGTAKDASSEAKESVIVVKKPSSTTKVRTNFFYKVRYRTRCIVAWEIFVLVATGLVGFFLELYQKVLMEDSYVARFGLYVFDILHIFKISIKFQTVYEDEMGVETTDLLLIASNYMDEKLGFYFDLLSTVPFEFVCLVFYERDDMLMVVWTYARMNRLLRVLSVLDHFHKLSKKMNINVARVRTINLFVEVIIMMQLTAALLLKLNCINPESNTHPEYPCDFTKLNRTDKFIVYMGHFSAMISIFTKEQSEEFYPQSRWLIIYLLLLMLITRILGALFMAEACSTFEVKAHNKNIYSHRMKMMREYIESLGVARPLLKRVWNYCGLLWEKQQGLQFPTLLEKAPIYLRQAAMFSMFGSHISSHPKLKYCHPSLARQMAERMRTATFFPGDYIAFKNDVDECMYFVHEGRIAALSESTIYKEVIHHELRVDETFGFDQGMSPYIGHEFTYKAQEYSVLVILKRALWIHLLDFFPATKELIYEEKHAQHS